MCLTQEGRGDDFRILSMCKSILSVTYSSTAVRSLKYFVIFPDLDQHTYLCHIYIFLFPLFTPFSGH